MVEPGLTEGLAGRIEHTNLKAEATGADILRLCGEAVEYGFYSVCVGPCYVRLARESLGKGSMVRVTTVAGFPLGLSASKTKAHEAQLALHDGADEVDMVMAIGAAREGLWDIVGDDIASVRTAVPGMVLKVIIETGHFSAEEIARAVKVASDAGADYVKTSTGFGPRGASLEDIRIMREAAGGRAKVKAAGGIRTQEQATAMIDAGADLIGTSSGPHIII
jgi:deoxyribose-phosphate aldolase